jgi:hypothetical protein
VSKVVLLLTGLFVAAAGCAPGAGDDVAGDLVIFGALYVDLHNDSPCVVSDAPPELSGVTVSFRGPDRRLLGEATTGAIGYSLLEFGEGKRGWTHPGCRYFAPYSATVARSESYEVSFRAPPPRAFGGGSWFSGVEELESDVITHHELEASAFAWDFEVAPSYVVGH